MLTLEIPVPKVSQDKWIHREAIYFHWVLFKVSFNYIENHTWVPLLHHYHAFLLPSNSSVHLLPQQFTTSLFVIIYTHKNHIYTHLYTYIQIQLVSTFNVACMCVCLWQTTWDLKIHEGTCPSEDWFSTLSHHQLPVAFHLDVGPCKIFLILLGMSACDITGQISFME